MIKSIVAYLNYGHTQVCDKYYTICTYLIHSFNKIYDIYSKDIHICYAYISLNSKIYDILHLAFYIPSYNSAFFSPISQQPPQFHIFFYEALSVISALAFCVGLQPLLHRLLIYSDSMNTVDIFHSLKVYDEYNHLLLFAIRLLLPQTTSLIVFHIAGTENTAADAVSCGLFHIASAIHPDLRFHNFKPPQDAMGAAL